MRRAYWVSVLVNCDGKIATALTKLVQKEMLDYNTIVTIVNTIVVAKLKMISDYIGIARRGVRIVMFFLCLTL
eukprot:m.174656 g.174656  ORF g.174656 m.174656 type:complete len:73 (+) comp18330_c0_seq1:1185-1403(+)